MIAKDVNDARSHVNFSNWASYRQDEQEAFLSQIGVNVRTGRMPLPRYTLLHRDAVLAPQERRQIYDWARVEKKRLKKAGPPAGHRFGKLTQLNLLADTTTKYNKGRRLDAQPR